MFSKARITRTAPLAAVVALMAVPAVSQAQTYTFGSRLDHEPSNSAPGHNCNEDGNNDEPTPACTRVAIDKSIAVPGGLTAPKSGTIVKFRVRAGAPGDLRFRLAHMKSLGFDQSLSETVGIARGAGTGPKVHVQGLGFRDPEQGEGNPVETFPAHLKVHKGDYLAIDSSSNSTLYCSSGGPNQMIFSPKLGKVGGPYATSSKTDGCELLVQAVMKR